MSQEAGEFNLIVTEVDSERLQGAASEFASAFRLDATIAKQVCKSAPIVFVQKLTKAEVKAITPKLVHLSKSGMEFRITARSTGKIPKVNWPIRPEFTAGGSGSPDGMAFEWENNAFICPGCGETFLFKRVGSLGLGGASAPAPAESAPAEPQVKVEVTSDSAPMPMVEPDPQPMSDVPESNVPNLSGSNFEMMEEAPQGVQPLEEAPPLMPELEPPQVSEAIEEILSGPATESEAIADPGPVMLEEIAESPEVATAAPEEAPPQPEAAPEAPPQEAEAPAEAGGERFNVFLSKITDASKRDKVAELISKVKKCNISEAKDLTKRLVIPLAKNVSKEQAEEILGHFKKLKIFGRMTKVK